MALGNTIIAPRKGARPMVKQYESRKKWDAAYKKERTKTVNVRFFPADMDIYNHLSTLENKSGYIKGLIRADMERNQ